MDENPTPAASVRFAAFEVDIEAGELRKNGHRIPLQEQPFRVLVVLLENSGKIVTREELQNRLWSADTFVEFDRGLNTAINKVREALGDSATNPRFVETVPRRGYRFLTSVEQVFPNDPGQAGGAKPQESTFGQPRYLALRFLRKNALSIVLLAAVAFLTWRLARRPEALPDSPLRKFAFTSEDASDSGLASYGRAAISPDGRQIAYFSGQDGVRSLWAWRLDTDEHRRYVSVAGGDGPLQKYGYAFWSPDGQSIGFLTGSELMRIPVAGGPAVPLCAQRGWSRGATWNVDGNSIVVTEPDSSMVLHLHEVSSHGGEPHLLVQPREPDRDKAFVTPSFIAEGNHSRFLLFSLSESTPKIVVQDLTSGRRAAIAAGAWPVYSPTAISCTSTRSSAGEFGLYRSRSKQCRSRANLSASLRMDRIRAWRVTVR